MTDIDSPKSRVQIVAERLYLLVAAFFFFNLLNYFVTGLGGPSLLAATMVPVTFVLFTLDSLRKNTLYPRLGPAANCVIAAVYCGFCVATAIYMHVEFIPIGTVRAGFWSTTDLLMGGLMALLVLEFSRKQHVALFVINVTLVLYAVYGWIVPGMFNHPGLSWTRVTSAMSVEFSTGIFSNLSQLALTVIASFLLVLSVLRAFGCVNSILTGSKRIAVRSPYVLPQTAVIGSLGVGTVSGSGAANAITIGSATIPAMIGAGLPRVTAAAIESASSLGGQLMPPVMGISAFLMAEFLGRSYFDVVARGYAPALIYYISIAVSVFLLSTRYRTSLDKVEADPMQPRDWTNLLGFFLVVGGLIVLMAVFYTPPMFAALYVFAVVGPFLFATHLFDIWRSGDRSLRTICAPLVRFIDVFAEMTSSLGLLLATLSIMTGAFVITGVPTKIGTLLIEMAGVNLAAMGIMAFCFGALLGTGLPPSVTYIITALIIAPPMIKVGVDPWVVHFFAFFLGVWGELTPPTSVVAAVTAKIADASFLRTLFTAIVLCTSLFTLMIGVFTRSEIVVDPGLAQLGAAFLILMATVGFNFCVQAQFSDIRVFDIAIRLTLAVISAVVLVYPNEEVAAFACIPVAGFIAYWMLLRRRRAVAIA